MTLSRATVQLDVQGQTRLAAAEDAGSFMALNMAFRTALLPDFPVLQSMRLADYQVRVEAGEEGKRPLIRVVINSHDLDSPALGRWSTVGVSTDLFDAAYWALNDAIIYRLFCALSEPCAEAGAVWNMRSAALSGRINIGH